MTTKSLAQRALTGLVSTDWTEREDAVLAMSRMSDQEIFYDVVEKAPLETEVFIDRLKHRISQIEAELAMHKAALLGAEQAFECYQESNDPNAADDALARMERAAVAEGVVVDVVEPRQLPN